MPVSSVLLPECPRYVPPPATQQDLEFADLVIIDLAKAQTPEGRVELYPQVRDALRTHGFMCAINHGYTQAQRDRIFDIADVPFTSVKPEEMQPYTGITKQTGNSQGFKARGSWRVNDGENPVFDQIERYGINRNVNLRDHPEGLRPFLPEIDAFVRHNHFNVLHPILRLLALSLELPEETLVNKHQFDAKGETAVRFIKYYERSEEDEDLSKNVWLKGHTDFGSLTILWSQPIGGLQILGNDGKWKWVRHIDNALVINTGDAMGFFSGGYYKPTIHRVRQPPKDQRGCDRLGVFYFAMPDDNVKLIPFEESPVLQKVGIERQCADEDAPVYENWRNDRLISYGRVELKKGAEAGIAEEVEEYVVQGIVVKHYN